MKKLLGSFLASLLLVSQVFAGNPFTTSNRIVGGAKGNLVNITASGCVTYATWNPSDKGANVTLSGGNLTAVNSAAGSVRSTIGKASGKHYWEMAGTAQTIHGVANGTHNVSLSAAATPNAWAYYSADGNVYSNAVSLGVNSTYTAGDVIGVALNMDAGTATFYKNNVAQGTGVSGLTGTIYAVAGDNATSTTNTANFGASAQTYSPPSGHTAGLCN